MIHAVLVDSNFFINQFKQGRNPFHVLAAAGEDWEFFTCGMVVLEVLRGFKLEGQRRKIADAFALMNFIPTTQAVWSRAQQLAWTMDRQGWIIPAQDHLIAASALHVDAAVLTADRHFRNIPGLQVLTGLM